MGISRVLTGDCLKPNPRPDAANQIIQFSAFGPLCGSILSTPMLNRMNRLALAGLKAQQINTKARIDHPDLERKKRAHPIRRISGAGKPDLYLLHPAICTAQLKPEPARAAPFIAQLVTDHRQQPIKPRHNIVLQTDRVRGTQPSGEMQRRARRRDRLGLQPQGLIQPPDQMLAKAPRKGRARHIVKVLDPPQTKPRKGCAGRIIKPQRCNRQLCDAMPNLSGG